MPRKCAKPQKPVKPNTARLHHMRDIYFYLLIVIISAGLLVAAFAPNFTYEEPTQASASQKGFIIEKQGLSKLTAPPGTRIIYPDEPISYAQLSSFTPRQDAIASAGVFATLTEVYEQAFGGKKVKVTITARQSANAPNGVLPTFLAAYFTLTNGDSRWHQFSLTPKFQTYEFTFTPRFVAHQKKGHDYVGIWPGAPPFDGQNLAMDIAKIQIKIDQ